MDHPLHELIGSIIGDMHIPDGRVILDEACGGNQHIQLFCRDTKSSASRYCFVDAAVLRNGQVRAIIEIEESDIRPVALCGKVVVSAIASHFIHLSNAYPMAEKVAFIQVIDTRKLGPRSSKLEQCRYLRESIRGLLQAFGKSLTSYEIFYGDVAEFSREPAKQELVDHLLEVTLDNVGRDPKPVDG